MTSVSTTMLKIVHLLRIFHCHTIANNFIYLEESLVTDIFAGLVLSQKISARGKFNFIVEGKYPACIPR